MFFANESWHLFCCLVSDQLFTISSRIIIKEFCRKVQHFPLLSVLCGKNSTEHNIRRPIQRPQYHGHPAERSYYSRSLRSAQSSKRVPSFSVAVTPGRELVKHPANRKGAQIPLGAIFAWCRRRDSNSHGHKAHWILSPARLPVSSLRQLNIIIIATHGLRCQC